MFLSLFTRSLAADIKTVLMPAALRLYSSVGCKGSSRGVTHNKEECLKKKPECRVGEAVKADCRYCKPIPELDRLLAKYNDEKSAKEINRELKSKDDSSCKHPLHESCAIAKFLYECCGNPCPYYTPRLDCTLYNPTDKAKREYQQTWVNCPPPKIIPRKVCCYDSIELPPFNRRRKTERLKTSCEFDAEKLKSFCAKNLRSSSCSRITVPFCKITRYPPLCTRYKSPSGCKKYCCPYPSYSECNSPCIKPLRNSECHCMSMSYCYAFRELKRKLLYNLPPPLPAWPPKAD